MTGGEHDEICVSLVIFTCSNIPSCKLLNKLRKIMQDSKMKRQRINGIELNYILKVPSLILSSFRIFLLIMMMRFKKKHPLYFSQYIRINLFS